MTALLERLKSEANRRPACRQRLERQSVKPSVLDDISIDAKEQARDNLISYCQYIDAGQSDNYGAKHLRHVASRLEAVERGEVKRLMIFLPPRHWKSSLTSEKFVSWYLGKHPENTIIQTSHSGDLAEQFSLSVRNIIGENEYFSEVFPNVRLRFGQKSVATWALEGAYRNTYRAAGLQGSITGKGCNLLLIDDPVPDEQAVATRAQRNKTYNTYTSKLRNRLEPGGAIILIMTRWHEDDLAGRLLTMARSGEGEQWEVVCLPAIAEPEYVYSWEHPIEVGSNPGVTNADSFSQVSPSVIREIDDIGRCKGDLLWPEHFDASEYTALKLAQGARNWAALYQQRPRAMEGSILNSALLHRIHPSQVPSLVKTVRPWDLAFSERQGADSLAGMKMGKDKAGNVYLLHLKKLKGRWPENRPKIVQIALDDGVNVIVGIEGNGTQLGYVQDVQESCKSRKVVRCSPDGTKEMRAEVWGSKLADGWDENGMPVPGRAWYVVQADWNQEFFDSMDDFPNGEHDDDIDTVSHGWQLLNAPITSMSGSLSGMVKGVNFKKS